MRTLKIPFSLEKQEAFCLTVEVMQSSHARWIETMLTALWSVERNGGGFVSLISHQTPTWHVTNMSAAGGRMGSRTTVFSRWSFPIGVNSVCSSRRGITWSFCCCRCYCCRWWRPADKTTEWDTHGKASTDTVLGQRSCNHHSGRGFRQRTKWVNRVLERVGERWQGFINEYMNTMLLYHRGKREWLLGNWMTAFALCLSCTGNEVRIHTRHTGSPKSVSVSLWNLSQRF